MTSDPKAATAFYADVVGWTPQGIGGDRDYTVLNVAERGIGGVMVLPPDAKTQPPCWVGYIHSADIDADVQRLKDGGGAVHVPPAEIPQVGRFAVLADPGGAMFMMLQPSTTGEMPPLGNETAGNVGWRELYAADGEKAADFYAGLFGWKQVDAMDMGAMGKYRLCSMDDTGLAIGAIMNKPEQVTTPCWQFYFNVPAMDSAVNRVKRGGGKVLMGPHQVPGGNWIVNAVDPQGAYFALLAPFR
ncbi:VOC family protein [Emcibacter sp. SYSU 3D8]|uniref:VOC family protein n=1 Tax=Emcibacter sp. SYSU 3D8 TaxID=3133969 RepID=UPI0031FE7495